MTGFLRGAVWLIRVVSLMLFGLVAVPSAATAQGLKGQIVGAWQLVSIYNEENGVKAYNFGENPVRMLIFDPAGHVFQFLSRPELPKFAAGNRLKGTDDENQAVVRGITAGFGTYAVTDADTGTVTIAWTASSYPNRVGTTETRTYEIVGDELASVNATASSGGTSYAKYMRAK